ncbi:hypothetical protein SAMN04488102_1129 [Alkalibacterium subtropicum]|uniref:DUF554 domain-containing protein n=1 Tax=Alkalibacterium subtropicum TaxID=753702 RepID=A0A1I1KKJ0_9LACT|nr:DUF554 domain-containing protein [Alkalibacterium subtropicum]SFC59188.1 hypothetical protein SAMN04488102_1129 [Alkalibacterium subtropicum]
MFFGVIINTLAIFTGSIIGLFVNKGIPMHIEKALMKALALSALYIGITGLSSGENTIYIILSMVIGVTIGEIIDLDKKINQMGDRLESRFPGKNGSASISKGFVMSSLIMAVGAMSIVGPLESGLTGTHTILLTKSVMDGLTSIILASSMGIGVLFSGVIVFVYQGVITLFASGLDSILTDPMINDINAVGSLIILALGLNILEITRIKVMNFVPAIFIPILFFLFY